MKLFLIILFTWVVAGEQHLLLTRVVTQPNKAESCSIYNPTPEPIKLDSIYICNNKTYHQIQTGDFSFHPTKFIAQFPDTSILAEETFHMPVSLGYPRNVSGLSDIVNNPIYSTGVGLLMYGKEHEDGNTARKKNVSTGFFSRFRGWFTENL